MNKLTPNEVIAVLINDYDRGVKWTQRHLKMGHSSAMIYSILDNLDYGVTYEFDKAVANTIDNLDR